MDVAECINGRGETHMVTHGPGCHYCGEIPTNPFETMRSALLAIQELHPIEETGVEYHGVKEVWCPTCRDHAPCPTRKLADKGLGGWTECVTARN